MNDLALLRAPQIKKEDEATKHIPYTAHLSPHTVAGNNGTYIQVIRCSGASFESADDDQINTWHRGLNALTRKIADTHVTLWSHVIRRDENSYPDGDFPPGFARRFNKKYAERVGNELLMVNELYVSIVYRPQTLAAERMMFQAFKKADPTIFIEERGDALEYMERLAGDVLTSLDRRYDAERLGLYEYEGRTFSEVEEFFAYLINGRKQRMPLGRRRIGEVIATTRPLFGNEAIEIRTPSETYFGAMLGVKEYTPETTPGTLNALLTLPFSFVLTQSFSFLSKEAAKFIVKTQRNRLESSGDDARSQIDELEDLLDDIQSNRIVMGKHHFSLFVKAYDLKELALNIAEADAALSDSGFVVAREDLALESAFWAQLPGNLKYRPRLSPITSRNWAGLVSLHNFPSGRRTGNHWGDALTLLVTEALTPLYFSYHASDPLEEDGGQ